MGIDGDYLLPVFVMADLFRGLLLGRLKRAHREGRITLAGRAAPLAAPGAFRRLLEALYRKRWVVYAKLPFAGPQQVFRYLGRYTHRVAVSDYRLLDVAGDAVVLRTRGDDVATMTPEQFVTRFLLHVLPQIGGDRSRAPRFHALPREQPRWGMPPCFTRSGTSACTRRAGRRSVGSCSRPSLPARTVTASIPARPRLRRQSPQRGAARCAAAACRDGPCPASAVLL